MGIGTTSVEYKTDILDKENQCVYRTQLAYQEYLGHSRPMAEGTSRSDTQIIIAVLL